MGARNHLRALPGVPVEPFGDFLAAVAHLAERDAGADGRAARQYLDASRSAARSSPSRAGSTSSSAAWRPPSATRDGALVFTETVRAANHAINRLDPLVSIDLITGATARRQRREILDDLRVRRLDAVAAPRVLDEGVDVPDANLGIVMSASRTRRQMIQRMGRILRRKQPGVAARFVIMFAKDTLEDPTQRVERDGFLDEIERISDATGIFDGHRFAALDAFLAAPGPDIVPEPERYDRRDPRLQEEFDRVVAPVPASPVGSVAESVAEPAHGQGSPYLELTLSNLPEIAKPKVVPKRLSTGQAPLEIEQVESGWRLTCTGCGEVVTGGPVPVAGPRRDGRLPLRLSRVCRGVSRRIEVRRRRRGSRRRRGPSRRWWRGTSRRAAPRTPWRPARRP